MPRTTETKDVAAVIQRMAPMNVRMPQTMQRMQKTRLRPSIVKGGAMVW